MPPSPLWKLLMTSMLNYLSLYNFTVIGTGTKGLMVIVYFCMTFWSSIIWFPLICNLVRYFCFGNNSFTWIGHIFCLSRDFNHISSWKIVHLDDGNLNVHLPIRLHIFLNTAGHTCPIRTSSNSCLANPTLKNPALIEKYCYGIVKWFI